jgi:PHD/YefM family antitoxin component YafN of YafNO toxin-antitoxin module
MLNLNDIRPLTEFLRNHKQCVERLQRERRPELLTVNGKAAVVIQDVASYQEMLERLERAEALEGIQRGLDAMARGDVRPLTEALDNLKSK